MFRKKLGNVYVDRKRFSATDRWRRYTPTHVPLVSMLRYTPTHVYRPTAAHLADATGAAHVRQGVGKEHSLLSTNRGNAMMSVRVPVLHFALESLILRLPGYVRLLKWPRQNE